MMTGIRTAARPGPRLPGRVRPLQAELITAGLLLIAAWYAVTRTTLLLAYGASGSLTLSQVQGICDSSIGQIGRAMSAQGAASCARADSYAMWANLAGFTGLLLLVAGIVVLIYRTQQRSAA